MSVTKTHSAEAPPGVKRHFYQFYKGREDFFRTAIPFLWLGLKNRAACLWIVSATIGIPEAIQTFQRQYDLIPSLENHQFLILSAEQWYLGRSQFSEHKVLQKLNRFVEEKMRLGFQSFRVVGDAGWLEPQDWTEFQIYEQKTHAWLDEMPVTALCAYPIWRCSLTQTKDVVDHHDSVFLTKL